MRITGADHDASLAQSRARWRWPRRRARLPGRGRLRELAADPSAWCARGRPSRLRRLGALGTDERLIGMLMIRDEDDIVSESLATAVRWFDRIYVLDGTTDPARVARTDAILATFGEICWHGRDVEYFPDGVTDGARQVLLERIREENGVDNWIGLLHADEFLDQDPRPMLAARHPVLHPSVRVRVAHAFLHVDDEADWDDMVALRDRVRHVMWPGVPESRFFFDDGSRDFDLALHSKVLPRSHRSGELVDGYVITQYNERNPAQVVARAQSRRATGWQTEHYARLLEDRPEIFVSTLDSVDVPFAPEFAGDPEGPFRPRTVSEVPLPPGLAEAPLLVADELSEGAALERGYVARNLGPLFGRDGLRSVLASPSRGRARRWVAAAARAGAFGQEEPVPGAAALARHVATVLGSRRVTDEQRRRVARECVVMLAGAGTDRRGWVARVAPDDLPWVRSLLRATPIGGARAGDAGLPLDDAGRGATPG